MSPETLESIYAECLLCAQIYIHGEALASCVSAVVVPDFPALRKWLEENGYPAGIDGTWTNEALCASADIATIYRNEFRVRSSLLCQRGSSLLTLPCSA